MWLYQRLANYHTFGFYKTFTVCSIMISLIARKYHYQPKVTDSATQLAAARQYALLALNILTAIAPRNQLPRLPEICDGSDKIVGEVAKGDLLEAFALEICGIAFTTNIPSVLVNSFGPIAYCKPPSTLDYYSFFASPMDSILTL